MKADANHRGDRSDGCRHHNGQGPGQLRPRQLRTPMTTIPYPTPGAALATDYFHIRDQFTGEEWDRFIAPRRFVDEEVLRVINAYWEAAELPWPLMRRLAELGLFEP